MQALSGARPRSALACLAAAAAVTIALAGCGTAAGRPGGAGTPGAGQPAAPGPVMTPAAPGSAAGQARTPRQRAEDDAARILAVFVAPPGARRLPAAPGGAAAALGRPLEAPLTVDLVDRASWWLAPGGPQQLLGWEERHLPHRFTLDGTVTSDGPPGVSPAWGGTFSLPALAGVLDTRQLLVQLAGAGRGMTAIRVDAQVTWIPARPASERVPSAASRVTIRWNPGSQAGPPTREPVTITDPATVRRIAALIDGLSLTPPDMAGCPMDAGAELVLTFRARPGGPALAVAGVGLQGCQWVSFTIDGKPQPGLGRNAGGLPLATRILRVAGLHWKLG